MAKVSFPNSCEILCSAMAEVLRRSELPILNSCRVESVKFDEESRVFVFTFVSDSAHFVLEVLNTLNVHQAKLKCEVQIAVKLGRLPRFIFTICESGPSTLPRKTSKS